MRKKSQRQSEGEIYRFRVRFGQERRASRTPCLSLGDVRRSTSGSGYVSLTISITCVSCSESLTSFTNRFFPFNGPPGFRMAFDAAERNGRFRRFQCQRSKEKETSTPLQKDSESQSNRQSHLSELSKN